MSAIIPPAQGDEQSGLDGLLEYIIWVQGETTLTLAEKYVLISVVSFSDFETGHCFPLIKTISERCGLSWQSVQRHLKTLERKSYIKVQTHRGGRTSSDYTLVRPVKNVGRDSRPVKNVGRDSRTKNESRDSRPVKNEKTTGQKRREDQTIRSDQENGWIDGAADLLSEEGQQLLPLLPEHSCQMPYVPEEIKEIHRLFLANYDLLMGPGQGRWRNPTKAIVWYEEHGLDEFEVQLGQKQRKRDSLKEGSNGAEGKI